MLEAWPGTKGKQNTEWALVAVMLVELADRQSGLYWEMMSFLSPSPLIFKHYCSFTLQYKLENKKQETEAPVVTAAVTRPRTAAGRQDDNYS